MGLYRKVQPFFVGKCKVFRVLCGKMWHRASFWHRNTLNLCNCRVPKLQKATLFAAVCRFFCGTAAFATLVCQRNCVFLCKGTKLKIVMPVFCGTELRFGIEKAISCATALCQNPRIRRSRILGLFAGFRLGMRFRL